jgi:hypothetical protein
MHTYMGFSNSPLRHVYNCAVRAARRRPRRVQRDDRAAIIRQFRAVHVDDTADNSTDLRVYAVRG